MPKQEQEQIQLKYSYILKQVTRKTKQFAKLGKIHYGSCTEYRVFSTAAKAATEVTDIKDILYKVPSALLITKTVEKLVPWLEAQFPIKIGEKMMEVVKG